MYLFVPEGMIKVVWDGYCHLKFTSKYWTVDPNNPKLHIFTFPWENAIYRITLNEEKKQCNLTIALDGMLKYNFNVHAVLLDQNADTHAIESLTFSITTNPPHPPQTSSFSIFPITTTSPIHSSPNRST